eukprot:1732102-Pyramimonas_sp.AAC.2
MGTYGNIRDHEVQQRHLHRRLGQVVRVAQLGGDVEAKVLVVLDGAVAEADAQHAPALERLLQEQRLQTGVQLLAHVLQQHRQAELRA